MTPDPNSGAQPTSGKSILRETPHNLNKNKKGKHPHIESGNAEEEEEGK